MDEQSHKSHLWVILLTVVLAVALCGGLGSNLVGTFLVSQISAQSCGDNQTSQVMGPSYDAAALAQISRRSRGFDANISTAGQTSRSSVVQALAYQQSIESGVQAGTVADPSPSPTEPGTECGINPNGNVIVAWALAMAAHLYSCPLPASMDVCYDKGMPAPVISYWEKTCPGCAAWQQGYLQCVMTVLAAYGLGGSPAPVVRGNAIGFWLNYARIPGWVEIPSLFAPGSAAGLAPPATRGLPLPGDMIVFFISWDPLIGHVGVVVKVTPPTATKAGSVTLAEANGPTPLITMSINPDLTVNVPWAGYYVTGYVRYVGTHPTKGAVLDA